MKLSRHDDLEKDLRKLSRFPTPRESLEAWERLFCLKGLRETPGIDHFPGFGSAEVYKARVVPLKENIGKSKGYRVIIEILTDDCCKVIAFSRHGIYRDEHNLIEMVRTRLSI